MTIYRFIKSVLDFLSASLLLVMLAPILVIIAILVRAFLGKPIFFKQRRIGLNEKPFYLYKFRTMTDNVDATGELLPDHLRVTAFGRFLRKTSLDELPQLFNIIKREMSLIGPRPLFPHYLPYYTKEEQLRHTVLPGITGWAQVNGRNLTPWDERMALDVWYVKNGSLLLDLKIILLTIQKVLNRNGVVDIQRTMMEDFDQYRKKSKEMNHAKEN